MSGQTLLTEESFYVALNELFKSYPLLISLEKQRDKIDKQREHLRMVHAAQQQMLQEKRDRLMLRTNAIKARIAGKYIDRRRRELGLKPVKKG